MRKKRKGMRYSKSVIDERKWGFWFYFIQTNRQREKEINEETDFDFFFKFVKNRSTNCTNQKHKIIIIISYN